MLASFDSFATSPRLVRMASGGWLALSAADAPIRIGVMGLSADDARERFALEAAAWDRLLNRTCQEHGEGVTAS